MTSSAPSAAVDLKSSQSSEHKQCPAPPVAHLHNAHGLRRRLSLLPSCPSTQDLPEERQVGVKKPTDPRQKSCQDQRAAVPRGRKRYSRPNDPNQVVPPEEWFCIDCNGQDLYYLKDPDDPTPLRKTDLIVCATCGFRFFGKTLQIWYGAQLAKREHALTSVPSPSQTRE
jgi:hypothetical protein